MKLLKHIIYYTLLIKFTNNCQNIFFGDSCSDGLIDIDSKWDILLDL